MKVWYCWYDNGTGYFEGPWVTKANNEKEALRNENMEHAHRAFATTRKKYNPNDDPGKGIFISQ